MGSEPKPAAAAKRRTNRPVFPPAALEWLTQGCDGPILSISNSIFMPRLLARSGFDVVTINRDTERAAKLRLDTRITSVVARPEAMPFGTCKFGVVLAHQVFKQFAPGLALPEMARVLKPRGWIAACYLARDDTVPWVRRLIELMRSVDPTAMSGQDDEASVKPLLTSKYFPRNEQRDYRIWVPISRTEMKDMVANQKAVAAMSQAERDQILSAAEEIYASASAAAEMRLPYQLRCWRAYVDQTELTAPIQLSDDGLIISL